MLYFITMEKFNRNDLGYLGYFKDKSKLLESSSGGAATAFSEAIIGKGGVVVGASYSKDFYRAEFRIIDKIEDLKFLKGSKYFAVDKKVLSNSKYIPITEAIANLLQSNRPVLFIGLGCDVVSLLNYCKIHHIPTDNLYTIDLFCHGVTYQEFFEEYIKALEKKYKSKVIYVSLRYKKRGLWTPTFIHVVFKNDKHIVTPFYESDLGYVFAKCKKNYCYQCVCKGDGHRSDITIGDEWSLTKHDKNYNKHGVSAIIVHSQKGKELIKCLDKNFTYAMRDINIMLNVNSSYYLLTRQYKNYNYLVEYIKKNGLHKAVVDDYGKIKYLFLKRLRLNYFIKKSLSKKMRNFVANLLDKHNA